MMEYVKVQPKRFQARDERETVEGKYWKRLEFLGFQKHIGGVSHVDCCVEAPYTYAVTASTRVMLYDGRRLQHGQQNQPDRTISRFSDTAYCGVFRRDGKLVAAGGENGIVQIFDANSRSVLRQLKGHSRPVHTVAFGGDKMHVVSGGDDASVRWWDVASGTQLSRLDGHADYVRAVALSPHSEEIFATGGYDHMCKVWDVRSNENIASFDHGMPIESVAFFPSESLVLTVGGPTISCWDMTGRRLLHRAHIHQKTIRVVKVARADENIRIVTGSLDGHVKVFDPATFTMVYACKYPAPVLSMAVAPDVNSIAVGLADGTLSFRKRAVKKLDERRHHTPRMTAQTFRYFIRNQHAISAQEGELVIAKRKKAALAEHDKMLRKFRYADALDRALEGNRPDVVFAVIEELVNRGGLALALRGRDEDSLTPLIEFLSKHIRDPRYSNDAIHVCHRILDTYCIPLESSSHQESASFQALMHSITLLLEQVKEEVHLQDDILHLKGMLDTLLSAAL